MTRRGAEAFVLSARELPVMPPVASEVIERAGRPDTDMQALAQLISRDAGLAVRVLKIANSSIYAIPRQVDSLHQAIVLLGYSTLRSVVVAACMKDVFARFGLAERLLWEHAAAAGVAARILARQIGGVSADEAFVGGLVHDIGKLMMYSEKPDRYQPVLQAIYNDEVLASEAEREAFGFDHAEVGRALLHRWKLSGRLEAAVGAHHDPAGALEADDEEGAQALAALLQVADRACLRDGLGRRKPSPELDILECPGAELLGLGLGEVDELLDDFREAYTSEWGVLG